MVGKVFPEVASTHLLLISSFVALIFTFGSIALVAVAMQAPPYVVPNGAYGLPSRVPSLWKGAPFWVGNKPIPPRSRNQESRFSASVFLHLTKLPGRVG
jgi:hypothetical protein